MSGCNIDWFEIPATDVERAAAFYTHVLESPMIDMEGPDGSMKAFANDSMPVGALIATGVPSAEAGTTIYFNTNDVNDALQRVRDAGGQVVLEKTSIGPFGFIGQFIDTEGNRVALHSDGE